MKNINRWLIVIAIIIASSTAILLLNKKDTANPTFAELENFNPNNFNESSTNIDNSWLPLKPGAQWAYEGVTLERGEEVPHRLIFTVTDLTKVIGGVNTVVAWDQDFAAGELVETELAFFAQDKDGVVWYLGEYPEEYEKGKFIVAPAWIHGLEDARAGIYMKKDPEPGAPSYSQGWGPKVNWTDRAQVSEVGQKICVPFNCYEDVLVIEEFNQEEANAFQLKYYARGVGNISVGWKGEDTSKETLELIDFKQLSSEELEEARLEALELEKRAYERSRDVYAHTQPSQQK